MTQHQTILNILEDLKPHCSNELRDAYVPEYRSRINELRKKGYKIEPLRCNLHEHKGNMQMWCLKPFISSPKPQGEEIPPNVTKWLSQWKEPIKNELTLF